MVIREMPREGEIQLVNYPVAIGSDIGKRVTVR